MIRAKLHYVVSAFKGYAAASKQTLAPIKKMRVHGLIFGRRRGRSNPPKEPQ
jgi:hypothetical protein